MSDFKIILDLPVKKEWYQMIENGEKYEEYREIKPYWIERLMEHEVIDNTIDPALSFRPFTHVRFRYGYTKRTMLFRIDEMKIGRGNPAWGAPADKDVIIIKFH